LTAYEVRDEQINEISQLTVLYKFQRLPPYHELTITTPYITFGGHLLSMHS